MRNSISTIRTALFFWSLLIAPATAFVAPASFQQTRNGLLQSSSDTVNVPNEPIVIALTREQGKNEKLRKQLTQELLGGIDNNNNDNNNNNQNNILIVELPCIAHADGPDYPKLAETLQRPESWDYVTITSPEAAKVLASVWNVDQMSKIPAVAAVGKATEDALEEAGIPVAFCPSKATAKVFVEELPAISRSSDDETATTVLYPASAQAATTLQDGLTARGFAVTRLNTYDTVTATWTAEQKAQAAQTKIVCVASPSSIKGWLANSSPNNNILAACIGETSAQACRDLGFAEEQIFYPEKPGIPGWVQSVQDALAVLLSSNDTQSSQSNANCSDQKVATA